MTDSRGEVGLRGLPLWEYANVSKVAYLMADISNVNSNEIKDLYESLENLSCMFWTHCRLGLL